MKRSARGIVTVFLALALLLTACLPAAGLASGTGGSRTVKAGFFAYPGYHEISDGTLSGYGFDFLTCLQRHTRLNFEFEGYENSWEEMQEMLLDGRIDLVTSARKTAEREEKFDFSEPIGTNSARISVRADDSRFIPGDYESMRGITIGILAGNSRNDDLAAFALEKGFGYIPVAFSTAEELSAALADGTVDAICTSSLRKAAGEKTVAEFAPEEFYVIVRKGDTALLDEVNYGINQMDVCEGNWRSDLYYENYTAAGTPSLSFTRREQEYIAAVQSGQTVITVTAQLDKMPYSFEEDGRLTGIIPDYFAHLMDMAGLPYTVLMPRAGADYADWVAENGVTVIMDGRRGDSPNAQYEYGLSTDSYITLTISRVTRRGFDGTISTVAAAGTMKTVYVDSDIAEKVEYISMSDPQDALRAVSRGEADACYVYTSMADRYINADPDGDLQAVILTDPVYDVYICIDPASGHELCSILNKCIRADIPGTLDGITARYTTVTYRNMDLSRYLYLHPAVLITAIAVLVVLIVSIAVAAFRARIAEMKNTQLKHDMEQQRKLEESLTFTDFFLDTYVSAYYVNMNDMSCQIHKRTDELEKNYPVVGDYFTSLQEYIARDVHPDDREKLLAVTEPGKMREILTRQSEYTHTFRDISGGKESIYRLQVIRGADAGHAAIGFIDITGELQEQQVRLLGAVPVSRDILSKASIGLWAFELDEGRAPRMYADEAMLPLLGLDHPVSPEETYHVWYDHIDAGAYGLVEAAVEKMSAGVHAEVQYPWHYPDGRTIVVRCGGVRNFNYVNGIRIEGTHQDVTETIHFQNEKARRNRDIIEILASEYSSVYYIDLTTDGLTPYTMNESTESAFGQIFRKDISYSEAYKLYVDQLVSSEDRNMMLDAGSLRNIMRELRDKKTFITTYRDAEGRYCEMKFVKVGAEGDKPLAVALGFADKDEELREKQEAETLRQRNTDIIGILASEYSSVYYIDLTTDELDPYTMNEETESEFGRIFRSGIKYSDAYRMYVNTLVYDEDRGMMLRAGSVYNILKELADKKTFITTYRSDNNGDPHYCEMKFVKVGDDENPQAVALGFADKDEELREEMQRKAIAARDAAVISGLSDDFGCVVYVDYTTGAEIHYRFDPLLSASIPGWESITNFDVRLGTLADTVVHPDDAAYFHFRQETKRQLIETVNRDGVYYHNFRIIIDGRTRYYQLKIVKDEHSDNHIIAGLRNVDETVRREMEYQEQLELANKSKTDFLFNMSHDIRTPMNAIIGFTQLAKKNASDPGRVTDCLSKIEVSGEHLLNLINEVLDMSRVEAGKLRSDMKAVCITEAAGELVTICRANAEERGITLIYQEKNIVHPVVRADELHINQIVMNILGNAIKYTMPGGSVTYTVEETPCDVPGYGRYILRVEDTGVGMSDEFLKHIYDAFSREDKATTSEIQGTGLGMAIVKRLVDYLDGTIDIESAQGRGTRVNVTLHLQLTDEQAGAAKAGEIAVDLAGKKVLLVEDNELNREIATDILTEQGVLIEEAVNGIDAVEHVKQQGADHYDFVLMDIQMPLMDGFEATAQIRKLPGAAKLPIIALSANAFEEDKIKSIEAGMNDHVAKPIVISELMAAIARLVKEEE